MYLFKNHDKNVLKILIFIICLIAGFYFAKVYQPQSKTVRIYKQALKDYDNGNYSNSYYLFSRVSNMSNLKPFAIYRQAMCAKALGDKTSELKRYQELFKTYPKNKLSPEAKYLAGQLVVDDNPSLALKYFNSVSKSNLGEDYQIAADYYIARIAASKMRYTNRNKIFSRKKTAKLEEAFRAYLEKYPSGRLAVNVCSHWKKFNPNMKPEDKVLIARAYHLAGMYNESEQILKDVKLELSWALMAVNAYETHNYSQAKNLTEQGVSTYPDSVNPNDYNRAVDKYLDIFKSDSQLNYLIPLFAMAKGKHKDYIWNLKCAKVLNSEKLACYNDLFTNFPDGKYAQNALLQIFVINIKNKNYAKARELAADFLNKYPKSENIPMVMFWAGKIEQKYHNTSAMVSYFQNIINMYPDSYYAYRAYWILKGVKSAVINADLDYKPVVYPYKYPNDKDILSILMSVKDYDLITKVIEDEFIASWIEYQKGNYASSMIIARDAMDKLEVKPVKTDLRWRLVYPQNYYKQVKRFADVYKNNDALMMAIIREESSFNSEAQSGVGAIGLMQLMPTTAHDIGSKYSIDFNTSYLFNPELNIKLGNLYYSTIRGMLDNKDCSAIAAYNGGIGSVTRWKSTLQYNDTDEFIEQIPYDETRNYVVKVFRSYWNYTRIYQKQ